MESANPNHRACSGIPRMSEIELNYLGSAVRFSLNALTATSGRAKMGIRKFEMERLKCFAGDGTHIALTHVRKPDEANQTAAAAKAFGVQALAIQAERAVPKACNVV